MRRQVTIGGLVALALLTGSVVAVAQPEPPAPGECAPAEAGAAASDEPDPEQADGEQRGLVPSARTGEQSDPGGQPDPDDEPDPDESSDEPSSDEPAGDEPAADEPADEPSDEEPSDEPAEEPSGEEPSAEEPTDGESSEDPADQDSAGEEPSAEEPAAEEPAADEPDEPAGPAAPLAACGASDATAAAAHDWGTPARVDDFDAPVDPATWQIYEGTGFDGQGSRTAEALDVQDGILSITGDAAGATGGMALQPGQMYGRWEARVRAPVSDESYNALLLLWPDDESAAGSEIDFMEMQDPTRQTTGAYLHHGAENAQVAGEVAVDGTQWHNWAVEWTPTAVTTYVDGVAWWRVDDPALLPKGPMHLCVQLDWFPTGAGEVQESSMQIDWIRQYAAPEQPAPADAPPAEEPAAQEPAAEEPAAEEPADTAPVDEPAEDGGDEEGAAAPPARLSEGAPDPVRPGLVDRAVSAPPRR